ncbi:MAG: glycosyltransferase family 4 protein [Acidimicrobiales bacterium]
MRVVHVVHSLQWLGGVEEHVAGLASGLSELGVDVEILCGGSGDPGHLPAWPVGDVPVRWHPKRKVVGRYSIPIGIGRSIRRSARTVDIVHVHQPFFSGTWIAAATRAPLVATFYLHPEHVMGRSRWRHRQQLRLLLGRVDLVASVSDAERTLIRGLRAPRSECVVRPGIARLPPARTGPPPERPLVLAVARLVREKGIEAVLRAAALSSGVADWVIVGDGRDRREFEELCERLGLDVKSTLRGRVGEDELAQLYRSASHFVSASAQESFGIAVMKAVANGCTPVVSDIAPHREIVEALGVTYASLFPLPANPAHIAEAILRERADPDAVGPDNLVPTWSDVARDMLGAYEVLLAGDRRHSFSGRAC